MTIINTVHTSILDLFSRKLRKGYRPLIVLAAICAVSFLLGLTMTCNVSSLESSVTNSFVTIIKGCNTRGLNLHIMMCHKLKTGMPAAFPLH